MKVQSPVPAVAKAPAEKPSQREADSIRFGFLLWDVSRIWRVMLDRTLKSLGVTRSQYSIIAFLSRRDGMTQTALASDLELTKVAVGKLIERMETTSLVERRADQSDARIRRVFLTRKGQSIGKKIRRIVGPVEEDMLGGVGDKDLASTIRTLRTIKEALLEMTGSSADSGDRSTKL